MLKVNNKNIRKNYSWGNYSEKNVWREDSMEKFFRGKWEEGVLSRGELFRGNCLGLVVFGGIIQG